MKEKLGTIGTYVGYLGTLFFVLAIVGRFYGERGVIGYQAINMFIIGIGLLVWGCWAKLEAR